MARYNVSFIRKFEAKIDDKLIPAIEALGSVSACAGIRNKPKEAMRARVNHHGAFSTKVPARPFIQDATRNISTSNFGTEIKKLIEMTINEPVPEFNKTIKRRNSAGALDTITRHTRAKPFGEVPSGDTHAQRTPDAIMRRIANQMAANQREAINSRFYRDSSSNGNPPEINQPVTIARKGSDVPMIASKDTYNAIEAWTE